MIAVRISHAMPFVVAGSPHYLQRHGTPTDPRELTKHSCLRLRFPSGALAPWSFAKKRRTFEVQVDGPITATELPILVAAAVNGAGLVQIPLPYVASELAAGRLRAVLADWVRPPVGGFFLYYPSRRQMRPSLRALVEHLRTAYRHKPEGIHAVREQRSCGAET